MLLHLHTIYLFVLYLSKRSILEAGRNPPERRYGIYGIQSHSFVAYLYFLAKPSFSIGDFVSVPR